MKDLFGTKESFTKERRKSRVSYNSRSAFMKANSLNASQAKEPWNEIKRGPDVPIWKAEGKRMTIEGNNVYIRYIYCFYFFDIRVHVVVLVSDVVIHMLLG